jgi:hypothetical protein
VETNTSLTLIVRVEKDGQIMKLSDLIEILEDAKTTYGDVPILDIRLIGSPPADNPSLRAELIVVPNDEEFKNRVKHSLETYKFNNLEYGIRVRMTTIGGL